MSEPFHIENFEITERLGVGGMATVWKARQSSLDRFVAIKVLSSHFSSDPADIERFRAEACAAGRLKHPGIVQVYDANFKDGLYYFVMELVAGYTVGEWIRRKGRLAEGDALVVAESVAVALDYAWSACRIIHCDIKPENIMVDDDGSLKITDLGLARAISSMQARGVEQEVLGTPAYMAPEQVTGQADLDCRADMYALGATLYHMVTGHLLFPGELAPDETMQKQLVGCVPSPAHEVPELSRPFVRLMARLLVKDRHGRPKNWQTVLEDIRRVRRGMLPSGGEPLPGASTIFFGADESDAVRAQTTAAAVAAAARHPVRDALLAALSLLLIVGATGGAAWFLVQRLHHLPGDATTAIAPAPPAQGPGPDSTPAPTRMPAGKVVAAPVSHPVPAPAPVVAAPKPAPPVSVHPAAPLTAEEAVRRLAHTLLNRGVKAASAQGANFAHREPSLEENHDYRVVRDLVAEAAAAQQRMLESFRDPESGQATVPLAKETITGAISLVDDDSMRLRLPNGMERFVQADEIDPVERLRHLERTEAPGVMLLKGLWACRSHATSRARDLFASVTPPLGPALVRVMDEGGGERP